MEERRRGAKAFEEISNVPTISIVVAWALLHHDELLADWELAQNGELPYPIDPLK